MRDSFVFKLFTKSSINKRLNFMLDILKGNSKHNKLSCRYCLRGSKISVESGGSLSGREGKLPTLGQMFTRIKPMVNLRGKPPPPSPTDYFIFHFRFFLFSCIFPDEIEQIKIVAFALPPPIWVILALNCTWSEEVICLDIRSRNINYAWIKASTSAALHGSYPLMVIYLHKSHWWSLPRDLLLITWGMYWWLGVRWCWKIKYGLPQGGYLHIKNFSHLTISELNSVKTFLSHDEKFSRTNTDK